MRFSSLSSASSDLALDDDYLPQPSLDFSFTTSISEQPYAPHLKPQQQHLPYDQSRFQISSNHFGRSNEWMQPEGSDSFAFDLFEAPTFPEQDSWSAPSDEFSQLYGNQWYPQQQQSFSGYQQYSDQQQQQDYHRRFPSTSSVASGAESHLSRYQGQPAPQYPAPQPYLSSPFQSQQQQPASWNYDTSSPAPTVQQIPTPIGTPTYSKPFQGANPRRTRPGSGREAALAAVHNSVRSALNSQWRPGVQSQAQPRNSAYSDMPRTPQTANGDEIDLQAQTAAASVPKLDRTVSDAQADELYNPASFAQISAVPRSQPNAYLQAQPSVLRDRLRDANEARSSSPSQPSGQASPWRDNANPYHSQDLPMQTAASIRQRQKAEYDQQEVEQHYRESAAEEPKTVSPKDAFPEQQVAKEDENLPSLFPTESNQSNSSQAQYAPINMSSGSQDYGAYTASIPQTGFTFTAPSLPASQSSMDFRNSYYQQHQPNALQYGPVNGEYSGSYALPAHLTSMETTKSEESEQLERSPEARVERPSPSDTLANGGRYTCPYSDNHGHCNARFDNPGDLNKHKREVHRQAGPMNTTAKRATAMTQTGPHKCTRINPSTGKPCNTVFSRPYDLTRHEDTIHGEGKKLRCPHCAEEKLFSRNDALTRHLKVVHNQVLATPKSRGRRQGT